MIQYYSIRLLEKQTNTTLLYIRGSKILLFLNKNFVSICSPNNYTHNNLSLYTKKMMIIWITWTLGSGKGTVVDYLVNHYGFQHFSATAFITEEIIRRNMPVNRDNMRIVADSLRETYGPDYIIKKLYEQAKAGEKNTIIESIRATGEAQMLKKNHAYLLAVLADPEVRYARIKERWSEKDNVSFEYFMQQEQNEMNNTDPSQMNLKNCIVMADYKIYNNGTLEELQQEIETVIQKYTI